VERGERGFILAGPDVRARSNRNERTRCAIYSECRGKSGHASDLVPWMAMLRHRATKSSTDDARLLISTSSPERR
jgi:hypothetical protein